MRTWSDALSEALALAHDPLKAKHLFERYSQAFSAGYRDRYSPAAAIEDIRTIENLSSQKPLAVEFYDPTKAHNEAVGLKVWSYNRPIPLSERVPILENMGFRVVDESTYDISPAAENAQALWLHDMLLERVDGQPLEIAKCKQALESCLLVVMRGVAENDGYNALVLEAELWWRDVALIRTLSRYLRQIRVAFSQDYMWTTLRKHSGIAAQLSQLFQTRFDPRLDVSTEERAAQEDAIAKTIDDALTKVQSLDEDRIIRHFVNVIRSAIRTNFYQVDAAGPAESADRHQVRQPQDRRSSVAAPALRNHRLFAARRRRASALRQSRARRHPLVGPAAGFPHRGAGTCESAAGQERRHRAGRRQGRLRPEIAAGRRHARSDRGRRRRGLFAVYFLDARHHRQYRRRWNDRAARQRGPA